MKKIIISLFVFTILFFCYNGSQRMHLYANDAANSEIQLILNGRRLEGLLSPPVISNDFTLVPARDVFEEFGAFVQWDEVTRHVYIAYQHYFIVLQIDNPVAIVNGVHELMDVLPQIINGRTMIPVRFVSESMGFYVDWEDSTRSVFLSIDEAHRPHIQPPTYTPTPPPYTPTPPATPPSEVNHLGLVPARDISMFPLVDMDFGQTSVIGLQMHSDTREGIDIFTSSEMSRVRVTLLADNRLAIDFYDAVMDADVMEFAPNNVVAFRQARIAQFQVTPVIITRVAIDLQDGVHFAVTMSADRQTLSIDFERNFIHSITHHSSAAADYITITGSRAPSVNVSHFSGPDRLVIDIPFANAHPMDTPINIRFVSSVSAHSVGGDAVQAILTLNERSSFSVSYSGNSTLIRITQATHRNFYYDNHNNVLRIAKDVFMPLHADNIAINNAYMDRQVIFTLPGDFSGTYGFGRHEINDGNMVYFDVETVGGVTRLVANSRRIFATTITEDHNYIYIAFRHPRDVYHRIVVIDPGHGGTDPGTTSIGGVHERYLVLDVSLQLLEIFNNSSDVKVYMTRRTNTTVSRPARATLANEVGADLFISVHMNSAAPNQTPRGTETHYFPDAHIRGSGFCSAQMAAIFQRHVQSALGTNDRGTISAAWDVLTLTEMPAVLSELGFLSNPQEAAMLKNPASQRQAAQAMFNATMEIFNNHNLR